MRSLKKIISILIILAMFITSTHVFANNTGSELQVTEYTEEYKRYLELPEEERTKVLIPRKYNVESSQKAIKNPLKKALLKSNATETRYCLKDEIPENMIVKNQKQTNSCWAFATVGALETTMAKTVDDSKTYDYSERHMDYATSRNFLNGETNLMSMNRSVSDGGDTEAIGIPYLTNGMGAVEEEDMPFENNEDTIALSRIKNKEVVTQLYDSAPITGENTEEIKANIKNHLKNYGAVTAGMNGANVLSDKPNFKNSTGAYYCNNAEQNPIDHAVIIVGWDDDYAVNNFNSQQRPISKGAWIIRNSWGEKINLCESLTNFSATNIVEFKQYLVSNNLKTQEEVTQMTNEDVKNLLKQTMENEEKFGEVFKDGEYTIADDTVYLKFADDGYMYVSYEDANIYSELYGLEKVDNKVNYDNLYQYNETGAYSELTLTSKVYVANIFDKKTSGKEYLTQVSLTTCQNDKCKVYVNPNGQSIDKDDLVQVKLKAGNTETVSAGYHTLEFLNAIELKSDKFAVVIEIEPVSESVAKIPLEVTVDSPAIFQGIKIEDGKCFIALEEDGFNQNDWTDLSKLQQEYSQLLNGDSTIKAFTVKDVPEGMEVYDGEENNENGKDEEIVINTNFDEAKGNTKNIKINSVAGSSNQEYATFDIEISGLKRDLSNDSNEYYYYLSPNVGEKNIENWVKITASQNDSNKLTFSVNTKDISNYEEISKSNTLYIYIKEISKKGTKTSTKVSSAISLGVGLKSGDADEKIKINDTEKAKDSTTKDSSTAPKTLPNTGVNTVVIIVAVIAISGFIAYIRYKKLSRYVK